MVGRKLAVVTGASRGIGLELARCCAQDDYALVIAAEEPEIEAAAAELRQAGAEVEAVQADLGTEAGIETLWAALQSREVDAFIANAGIGTSGAFLDQDLAAAQKVIDLNISGTMALIHRMGRRMREQGRGRILILSSILARVPGSYLIPYAPTKAFLENFSYALRDELKGSGVTVTCLMPGATKTDFYDRAGMEDTVVGQGRKPDPAGVARQGFEAMQRGEAGRVSGLVSRLTTAAANVIPNPVLAAMNRKLARPRRG